MKSLSFSKSDAPSISATEYGAIWNGGTRAWDSTENFTKMVVSAPGTLRNMQVVWNNSPGSGRSQTITLRKNGASSALAVEVADTNTTGIDDSNEVSVSPGDIVNLMHTDTNAIFSGRTPSVCIEFEGDNAKESNIFSGTLGSSADGYFNFQGGSIPTATQADAQQLIDTPGVISDLYVALPENSADGQTYTLYKNGVATSLTVTVSSGNSTGNDTSNTVSVVKGDLVCWYVTGIGTQKMGWLGATFTATTDEEFPICASTSNNPGDTGNDYGYINHGHNVTPNGTESTFQQVANAMQITSLSAEVTTAPGSGSDWVLGLRVNGSLSSLTATIDGTNTTGSGTSTVDISSGDLINIEIDPSDPSNEPTLPGEMYWGMTGKVVEAGATFIPKVIMF